MTGVPGGLAIGKATVQTINGRNPTPEEWAEMALNKILVVPPEGVPQEIREQAVKFRDRIGGVMANYIRMAIEAERKK